MNSSLSLPRFHGLGNSLVAIVLVAGAVISSFTGAAGPMPPMRGAVLVISAVAYTLAVTLGAIWLERSPTPRRAAAHFVGVVLLGAAPCIATRGYGSIVLLVVVSQSELFLPRRFAAVVWACAFALPLAVMIHCAGSAGEALRAILRYVAAMAFVIVFSQMAKRERHARSQVETLARAIAVANGKLQAHARHIEELAATKERNRIARDIHDGLGHCLTAIHVQLRAAEAIFGRDPERSRLAWSRAKALVQDGLAEVRASVSLLRTAGAPGGLLAAVDRLCDDTRDAGLAADLRVTGERDALQPATELALYRAVQEALTNVRKHARASRAVVELRFDRTIVRASVIDDGVGAGDTANGGFGLAGLRERVDAVGGRAWFEGAPGRGFAVHVEVPR